MTPKQKEKLIQEIRTALKSFGFQEDHYGNFKKETEGKVLRYKFGKTALRREVKGSSGQWIRVASNYYKNISIIDGKISGLKY